MNGLPYYKRYPRDFIEGTIGLPFEVKVTYSFVLDLIYMQGGKLPDDARYISGLLGVSVRKWNSLRESLISAGKIVAENGCLTNYRAVSELESLAKLQDKQRENGSKPKKNKHLQKPRLNHTEPEPDITLDTDVSKGADAPLDPEKIMFDAGVKLLTSAGMDERKARSFIGAKRKANGTEAVMAAIGAATRAGAVEPVAFIQKVLAKKPAASGANQNAGAFGILKEVG